MTSTQYRSDALRVVLANYILSNWDQVARALATSPEEARLRVGPGSPIAGSRWPHDL